MSTLDEAIAGLSTAAIAGPSTVAAATTPSSAEEVRKQRVMHKVGWNGIDCQGCRAVVRKAKEFQLGHIRIELLCPLCLRERRRCEICNRPGAQKFQQTNRQLCIPCRREVAEANPTQCAMCRL